MPNLMRRHMQRLDNVMRGVVRSPVTYVRCDRQIPILATIGFTDHQQIGSDDVMTSWRSVDFIITRADIAALGEPKRGDVIYSDHEGQRKTYTLVPVGENQHLFKPSDEFGIALRVHTTTDPG